MPVDSPSPPPRRIRSFVRRSGRLTPAQQGALEKLWPRFGIDDGDGLIGFDALFGRRAARVLEIGFGNGETLVEQAVAHPEHDFVGIEVHEPGIGHCLLKIGEAGIGNIRLIRNDALDILEHRIADNALARINLYFPDPWPKKRHHKRRIVQDMFLELGARKLEPGGSLCIATDWANFADHVDEVVGRSPHFTIVERREHLGDRPIDRPVTKFERRGLGKGHSIVDWHLHVMKGSNARK
ncbi:MAG: tRNA (guanosine(46)-N7)-methyltransferase TrmB [Woeseia sp.]